MFTSISSGISGTFQEAKLAIQDLLVKYPERQCYAIDSLAASFGEGLMVLKLAELRNKGFSIREARDWLEQRKQKMRQVFTVGDLHFLRRGGRLSARPHLSVHCSISSHCSRGMNKGKLY